MLDWYIVSLVSAKLRASMWFSSMRRKFKEAVTRVVTILLYSFILLIHVQIGVVVL